MSAGGVTAPARAELFPDQVSSVLSFWRFRLSALRILHDKLYHGLIGLSIIINKMRTIRHYRQIRSVHFMHIANDFINENDG